MATPLRYLSAGYVQRIAGDIHGGDVRTDPDGARAHAKHMTPPSRVGYVGQLHALWGWTSMFWLPRRDVPALVLAGEDDPVIAMVAPWSRKRSTG